MTMSGPPYDAREVARLLKSAATISYSGDGVEKALASALELVCAFTQWPLGHVYLLNAETNELISSPVWFNGDEARFGPFVEATAGVMPKGVGLPGRILATGEPAWIMDVRTDANFPRAAAALACGLGAGFGFPIVSAHGVAGVLEFFALEPKEPDDALLDLLSHIGVQLGHVLDRHKAHQELVRSEARLSEAERMGAMGAWTYDVERDSLDWSKALCALYGIEVRDRPTNFDEYLARIHPEDVERVRGNILRCIETRSRFDHEYRLLVRPTETRWVHSRGEVISPADQPLQMAGYCQDLTARKNKEETARVSQERLAEAQRIAHLGSWTWEMGTDTVKWSDELYRIYGLEPGQSPATFDGYLARVHPDDRERVRSAVLATAQTRQPFEHDYRILRPSGELRWVHARGEVVELPSLGQRLIGYCHDISQRKSAEEIQKRLEDQLHQAQRLESLGRLAGGVAHDFNNLLGVILGYVGFAEKELSLVAESTGKPHLGSLRHDLDQITRAAWKAADLTRQLLAFGRREVARPRVMNLNDVISDIQHLLHRSLGEHVQLLTVLDPELWWTLADPSQLEHVLINLVVNARDAMPTGGTLVVETANVHLDVDTTPQWQPLPAGRYVRMRVKDSGQGMAPEILQHAFEPFFTTKPEGQGTGLGLATVYGIITQSGGAIQIQSEVGLGSTVTALLPATEGGGIAADLLPLLRPQTIMGNGETVLLVENEDAMRDVMTRMLGRNGYRVISASTGPEAIAAAREHPEIRVLLTDVFLPGMLGAEIATRITTLYPAISVLYTTGHAVAFKAQPGEARVLVEKPFSEDELLEKIRQVLEPDHTARR